MKKQSAEDYLDKLLNSVNGEEDVLSPFDLEDEMKLEDETDFEDEIVEEMVQERVSRRVSKSEEEFLREFEAELEADDFDDFLKNFGEDEFEFENTEEPVLDVSSLFESEPVVESEPIVESEPMVESETVAQSEPVFGAESVFDVASLFETEPEPVAEPAAVAEPVMDSFDLGGVDLGALLNEATSEETANAAATAEEDMFSSLFGTESTGEEVDLGNLFGGESNSSESADFANLFGGEGDASEPIDLGNLFSAEGDASGSLDLGNLGEADLMSLLSGDGGLSDLGDMLSQGESGEFSMDELDAFAAFADSEMSSQTAASEESRKKTKKKGAKGKGGFFDKLKEILLSDDEDDEVEIKASKGPSADQLSGENAEILAQMDAEEKGGKAKGGFFGKLKKEKGADDKKEKKEKKPKAPKPKKEKKPKAPKPKKEKKPKEVDNTPPLPKGPVMMIWIMALSMFALVYIGTDLVGYSSYVNEARSYYNTGNYAEAYQELIGLDLKEKDMELYNQAATLATVDSELNAYKAFLLNEDYTKALDSLICAAGRCELNEDSADVYGCLGQMEILKKTVSNELDTYGMTYEQALDMYHIKDREDYTIALYTKLKELGLE